ncbi:piggyBac transposable element-derived protein 2 isoform X1 [Syngnathus scovelli]|uniref:piggyBac transposable element-derived protein 2 isoform X1 n=1 Tax=Syngnathus scovelli TaxID=161590 RepID=UPI00210FDC98|nr:piggyBac transposable element-derived protein 3 [Syngnathus scovelli]XP_049618341.1 piggyBac transposable element-derived protein 3 [Syngnathus scovelli]XP_049618342.1 piggyBac transposable element-derived protein 3 [Syngnathus scovelli]XP_049618343.1 piggyBac transposable element-derived protein 3 [Syngnathus scovelli]XP_049618344.1 piggyBac transposable element-derived protein 3 [Syngnathus scovelli]XP_049618345.1 piggyBac transposable element-derived protein 3 [Syngnathus scovelli]XP_04
MLHDNLYIDYGRLWVQNLCWMSSMQSKVKMKMQLWMKSSLLPPRSVWNLCLTKFPDARPLAAPTIVVGKSANQKLDFFLSDVYPHLVRETKVTDSNFQLTIGELKSVLGILVLSGYHSLPSRRHDWSTDEDLQCALVAGAISRNRFEEIIRYIHCADNAHLNLSDRMTKLRPMMDILNARFREAYPIDCNVDLDEAIIEYFGRHQILSVVYDTANKIALTRWKDNDVVTIASTLAAEHPLQKASRWSAKEKKKVAMDQPFVVQLYNRSMGGTDRADQSIGLYRINMRRKKWWWPIFTWMLDAAVFNAWVLHRLDEHGGMSLLDFRRKVARTLLAAPGVTRARRVGRSRLCAVADDYSFDGMEHWPEVAEQGRKCALPTCKSRPSSACSKCRVALCMNCFRGYHQPEQNM